VIRTFIQGNLKLTHSAISFIVLTGFVAEDPTEKFSLVFYLTQLHFVVVFPVWMSALMYGLRDRLREEPVKKRIGAMYNDLRADEFSGLLRNVVFCFRNLALVLMTTLLAEWPYFRLQLFIHI